MQDAALYKHNNGGLFVGIVGIGGVGLTLSQRSS